MKTVSERAKLCLSGDALPLFEPRWYALRTRSRHEKYVRSQLAGHGFEPFLPLARRLSQWKDRKKEVDIPLFPGYCFARFAWKDHLNILKAPGVVQIIGGSGRPESIPDHEIDAIQKLMTTTIPYDPLPYLREGTPVRIVRGPLEGIEGIVTRRDKGYCLVIAVHLIHQAVSVKVDLADVTAV